MAQHNQLDDFADSQRTASWFIIAVKTGRKPKVFSCGAGTKCNAAPVVKQSFDKTLYAWCCALRSQEKLLGTGASRDTIWIGNLPLLSKHGLVPVEQVEVELSRH